MPHERVLCLDCEGTTVHMTHHADGSRTIVNPRKRTCPACEGTGYRIQFVLPFPQAGEHQNAA